MSKTVSLVVAAFFVGVAVAIAALFLRPSLFGMQATSHKSVSLSPPQLENVMLHASLKDGQLIGTYFNQNAHVTVVQITVEAVPKDEGNFFNKFSPRFFNVAAIAQPRAMSTEFRVETGVLNPEFHTLRVVEAQSSLAP